MYFQLLIILATLVFAFPKRIKSRVSAVVITIGALVAATASLITLTQGYCQIIPSMDNVNAVFVLAISIVGVAASIYAIGFTKDMLESKRSNQVSLHFFCMAVLFYSMIGVLTANEKYEFLLWWELMTLSSFILVIFDASRKEVLHAGISYLLLMHLSFFFLLGGFSATGSQMWEAPSIGVWVMFLIGFGLKSALFPLHVWLPVTYKHTPSHVTAMMSGVMINMGVYGIYRTVEHIDTNIAFEVGLALFCIGIISGVFGIIKAAMHTGLKRLLGYSSVENMGIITMAIGMGAIGRATGSHALEICGFGGALLHTMNHSAYKSMLFMVAGAVEKATGLSDLNRMGGLMKFMPVTAWVFGIGALAICAIPPLSGFFSEFTIFTGLFEIIADGSNPIIGITGIIALALIGGLAILTFSKAFAMTFLGQPRCGKVSNAKETNNIILGSYALPLVCILAGGVIFPFIFIEQGQLQQNMLQVELVMGVVLLLTLGLWYLRGYLQKGRVIDTQPTWGCAFTAPDKDMQYTSSSMSRELQDTISSNTKLEQVDIKEIFPSAQSFKTEHTDRANEVITQTSQKFLRKWTARLALFQTGKANHYVLHALLFLILILLLSLIDAI